MVASTLKKKNENTAVSTVCSLYALKVPPRSYLKAPTFHERNYFSKCGKSHTHDRSNFSRSPANHAPSKIPPQNFQKTFPGALCKLIHYTKLNSQPTQNNERYDCAGAACVTFSPRTNFTITHEPKHQDTHSRCTQQTPDSDTPKTARKAPRE